MLAGARSEGSSPSGIGLFLNRGKRVFWYAATFSAVALLAGPASAGIDATKHNLSVSGPGTIKATSE
ncbi:MAG: hypothetical protein QME79_04110, partial [Bacillota bacterium]|nr:hypothetical protein [Bacillota bacterium]